MDRLLPTVLIVEDHPDTARTLALLLRHHGFQARVARDGREALRAVDGWEPDVVLLDLGLPGGDGYEVASLLRRVIAKGPRVVAVTAYNTPRDFARSWEEGFDHHLVKPVDPAALLALLRSYAPAPNPVTTSPADRPTSAPI
jgi:CheY-like chemotaxis protein